MGRDSVSFIYLPEHNSSKKSRIYDLHVAEELGVALKVVNITPILRRIGVYRLEPITFGIQGNIQFFRPVVLLESLVLVYYFRSIF